MNNYYRWYDPNSDMHPFGYVPPFNNLSIAIDFTACRSLQTRRASVYTQLENHLVNTQWTVAGGDVRLTGGTLAGEAQAFLSTIAPGAVLTSIFNDGCVK